MCCSKKVTDRPNLKPNEDKEEKKFAMKDNFRMLISDMKKVKSYTLRYLHHHPHCFSLLLLHYLFIFMGPVLEVCAFNQRFDQLCKTTMVI